MIFNTYHLVSYFVVVKVRNYNDKVDIINVNVKDNGSNLNRSKKF